MARLTYLERRNGTYYARIDIPGDLVQHFKTTTRKASLRTKDEKEARRLLMPLIQNWLAEFEDVRSRRGLTEDDKAAAVWQHYSETLDRYDSSQVHRATRSEIEASRAALVARFEKGDVDLTDPIAALDASLDHLVLRDGAALEADQRRLKLEEMRRHLASGDSPLTTFEAMDYARRHNLIAMQDDDDVRDLARRLMRAEIEAIERTFERDRGDFGGVPKDPIVRPANSTLRETAAPGEKILELFATYERENPKSIKQDTLNQARRDIGTFVDYVGHGASVRRIDKKAVREWKALLIQYPVKATETNAFKGMSIAQIVRENEKIGKPALTPRTVNRYLASLSAFCVWLAAHDYISANPCEGMHLAKDKKKKVFPFNLVQLQTLFASPWFVGCAGDTEWRHAKMPGDTLFNDHRYWIPLIMLYSGARPGEIAQLDLADVRELHSTWIMHITIEGEGDSDKSVKTESSMRVVPVHSELIRLGFLRHHERMIEAGHSRLFPDALRNSRGQMIADMSKEFGKYLTAIGLKKGRGLSLYSLRHGSIDAFRAGGFLDDQFKILVGHGPKSITGQYGVVPEGLLQERVKMIEAIAYPGLDLSELSRLRGCLASPG